MFWCIAEVVGWQRDTAQQRESVCDGKNEILTKNHLTQTDYKGLLGKENRPLSGL